MRGKTVVVGMFRRLAIAAILALALLPIAPAPAMAQSLSEYFSYSYTVQFNKTQVTENEVFTATVTANATCTKNLPWPASAASEAMITGNITAEHQSSGTRVTLNASYSVSINPFPNQAGNSTQAQVVVPLRFPAGSQWGTYTVVANLIEAKVKVAFVWISVTAYLPASQTVPSTITCVQPVLGGGGGGGGGGGAEPTSPPPPPQPSLPPGTADVSSVVDSGGVFLRPVMAQSGDGKCTLTIGEGTKGLSASGERVTTISASVVGAAPPPPANHKIAGDVYELGPSGATFQPPITVTISYIESQLPQGTNEENLVMATWDATAGKWVVLTGSRADPEANTVSAPVSHFSAFTILSYTAPAAFTLSELKITPAEVKAGEQVTIRALVSNTGAAAGSYKVGLRIDNELVGFQEIAVEGHSSANATFTVAKNVIGTYTVTIGKLSGTFVVKGKATFAISGLSITPAEVNIGEPVTIMALVRNTGDAAGSYKVDLRIDNKVVNSKEMILQARASERVTFTVTRQNAGTYSVTIDGLAGAFIVRQPAEPARPWLPEMIDRWPRVAIIGAGIALIVVVLLIILFIRSRAY